MKKHYLRFGLIYCILALLVFAAAISFYTGIKIDKANEIAGYSMINSSGMFPASIQDPETIMRYAVRSWKFTGYQSEDEGFYSSVIDTRDNFKVLLESSDMIKVMYYGEIETEVVEDTPVRHETKYIQLAPGDERYMLFDEPLSLTDDDRFALHFPDDVTIEGAMCDDTFIYGGTLTIPSEGKTKTFEIARPSQVNEANSVPYEDWIVRLDSLEYYSTGENSGSGRLNKTAHRLSNAFVEKFKNGNASSYPEIKKGIFTSTASRVLVYDGGNYLVTFYSVIHPLQMVLRQNLKVYIPALLVFLIVEAIIIFAVRKLYLNQKIFELRSRKLTQGIAHDLKAPLAETKAHMETWEKLGDEERQEYSEKIISEVDHMSGMVTKLLELSKTNGRNIKLNKEDVDLLLLTRNIKRRNQEKLLKKNIDISIIHEENTESYPVYADLELMQIAINSFMSNAIKYCDKKITVKLNRTGRSISFSITNDGAKIDNNNIEKIWDAGYIPGKEEADSSENSGVGLPVVKSILDAHHARYSCYNSPKGTTFSFSMEAYDGGSYSGSGEDLI